MLVKRVVVTALVAALTLLGAAIPASADHVHVRVLGNGQCVILAEAGGEKYVELPGYGHEPENRRHPLHVKVHLGRPGNFGAGDIFVYGSPEGDDACDAGYVNAP